VVVFDLGKVLLDFDYAIAARRFISRCRMGVRQILQLIDQSPLLHAYETGLISTDEFFAKIQSIMGFQGEQAEFEQILGDIFTPIEPMVQLLEDLRSRGYPTFVFSNTNELTVRFIRKAFPFYSRFSGYILSFEQRVMKPDPRIYTVLERASGCAAREILYLDDRPENITAAIGRGWQAVLHENPEKSQSVCRGLGLIP
jgi:HAD superfamily hydrolase (TIGR01509 family)